MNPNLKKQVEAAAEEHGIKVSKHRHERLPSTKAFGIPQNEFDGKPDFYTSSAFLFGAEFIYKLLLESALGYTTYEFSAKEIGDPEVPHLYIKIQKLVDEIAALKAENEKLRKLSESANSP